MFIITIYEVVFRLLSLFHVRRVDKCKIVYFHYLGFVIQRFMQIIDPNSSLFISFDHFTSLFFVNNLFHFHF